jgi:hypothetical protein
MHPKEAVSALSDYWTCDEDGRGSWKMVSYRDAQIINEALSTLTALTSQEGAQAGEAVAEPVAWTNEETLGRLRAGKANIIDLAPVRRDWLTVALYTTPRAPDDAVREAGILDEMDRMWRQFIAQCESIEEEPDDNKPDSPAAHFMRGYRFAAKRIRRSVDHPKYNNDYPIAQAAFRARKGGAA